MFSASIQSFSSNAMDAGVDFVLSLVKSEWSSCINAEEKIQGLKHTFRTIGVRLVEAEKNLIVEGCWSLSQLRLHRLKSLYFDIENLLDEYETVCRLDKSKSSRKKRKWYETWLPTKNLRWILCRKLDTEIYRVNQQWEEIKSDERELGPSDYPEPFQHVLWDNYEGMLGREEEKDEIISLLVSDQGQRNDSRSTVPVIPIYGTAGIGKSTLARMVYMDPRVDTYFSFKAWVTLSSRCNTTETMNKIYEHFTAERYDYEDLHLLSSALKDYLTRREGDKYLLVIDNLWANTFEFWDALQYPLQSGGQGSKILITTRNKNTCRIMRAISRSSLSGLDDEECWQLMEPLAFPQGVRDDHQQLLLIGKEIAKKCQGSPLAAKTFGLLLCGKSEEEWVNKLSDMRSLKEDQNGVLARLMVSYYQLHYNERQCLAYCCIFPNGYEFQRDEIIRCWGAEGLIQPDLNGQCQPEEHE